MSDGWFGGFFTAISVIAVAVVAGLTFNAYQRMKLMSEKIGSLECRLDCHRKMYGEVSELLHNTRVELGLEEDRLIHGWYTLNSPEGWKAVSDE